MSVRSLIIPLTYNDTGSTINITTPGNTPNMFQSVKVSNYTPFVLTTTQLGDINNETIVQPYSADIYQYNAAHANIIKFYITPLTGLSQTPANIYISMEYSNNAKTDFPGIYPVSLTGSSILPPAAGGKEVTEIGPVRVIGYTPTFEYTSNIYYPSDSSNIILNMVQSTNQSTPFTTTNGNFATIDLTTLNSLPGNFATYDYINLKLGVYTPGAMFVTVTLEIADLQGVTHGRTSRTTQTKYYTNAYSTSVFADGGTIIPPYASGYNPNPPILEFQLPYTWPTSGPLPGYVVININYISIYNTTEAATMGYYGTADLRAGITLATGTPRTYEPPRPYIYGTSDARLLSVSVNGPTAYSGGGSGSSRVNEVFKLIRVKWLYMNKTTTTQTISVINYDDPFFTQLVNFSPLIQNVEGVSYIIPLNTTVPASGYYYTEYIPNPPERLGEPMYTSYNTTDPNATANTLTGVTLQYVGP